MTSSSSETLGAACVGREGPGGVLEERTIVGFRAFVLHVHWVTGTAPRAPRPVTERAEVSKVATKAPGTSKQTLWAVPEYHRHGMGVTGGRTVCTRKLGYS